MREHSIAFSASLLFHLIVVALFLRVPFDQYVKPKLMVLDFSLEKGRTIAGGKDVNHESGTGNRETQIANRKSQIVNRMAENEETIINRQQNVQKGFATEVSSTKQGSVDRILSDPAGQAVILGDASRTGIKSDIATETGMLSGKGSQNIAVSPVKGKTLNFENNGADERDFAFIRDTILKRIKDKYPDRARRMGWEGKVLLSFVVLENGSIQNVKIINSSGFRILDDSARDVIEKTTFTQKIPYSRPVHLPVEYKLQ
jgi:TonB family protein